MKKLLSDKIKAWFELCRIPNIFTVPGDPIAGFLLLSKKPELYTIILLAVTVCGLYFFGLITNDIFDYKTDSEERPSRPIPSGRIKISEASISASVLALGGLFCAYKLGFKPFVLSVLLFSAVLGYNLFFKKYNFIGPAVLGLCRFLSFSVGVSAVSPFSPIYKDNWITAFFAVTLFIYVFGLSRVAKKESMLVIRVSGRYPFFMSGALCLLPVVPFIQDKGWTFEYSFILYLLIAIAFFAENIRFFILFGMPFAPPVFVQRQVGRAIVNILFIQGAAVSIAGYPFLGLLCLGLIIPAKFAQLKFYSS